MLSAFSPRARRQRSELGGTGRGGGREDRGGRRGGGSHRCGLDEALLWSCPRRAADGDSAVGGDSRGVVFFAEAISGMEGAAFECGFFRGGWDDLPAAVVLVAGPRGIAAAVSLHGASRAEIERDY